MEGYIKPGGLRLDKGYGFIEVANEPDYFFHKSELLDLPFDETLVSRRVSFVVVMSGRGPCARAVQPTD